MQHTGYVLARVRSAVLLSLPTGAPPAAREEQVGAAEEPRSSSRHNGRGGRAPLLHPFLFALHPVLVLYRQNLQYVRFAEAAPLCAAAVGLALLALVVARLLVRGWRVAGLIASAFVVFFFSYGHVIDHFLPPRNPDGVTEADPALALAWLAAFVLMAVWIGRRRGDLRAVTILLGLVAGGLVVTPLFGIVGYELRRPPLPSPVRLPPARAAVSSRLPDIYYIILDRYARERELRDLLGYDNRAFLNFLRAKGFYVADDSCTNYARTGRSLASSLNMSYLDELVDLKRGSPADETPLKELIRHHAVGRFLKARGYRYVHLGAWWEPTRTSLQADVNLLRPGPALSEFGLTLAGTTLARPLLGRGWRQGSPRQHRECLLFEFDQLDKIGRQPGPKFVFAHVLSPHLPYVFAADGHLPTIEEQPGQLNGYLGQLEYTNARIRRVVERLLADSEVPPIIILQADEGPLVPPVALPSEGGLRRRAEMNQGLRRGILNAYYLPGGARKKLYPSITPVNTFRLVLSEYFGADCPMLPDRPWEASGFPLRRGPAVSPADGQVARPGAGLVRPARVHQVHDTP